MLQPASIPWVMMLAAAACMAFVLTVVVLSIRTLRRQARHWRHRKADFIRINKELTDRNDEVSALLEELSAANEELTATNEELSSTNEELTATNDKLQEAHDHIQAQSKTILAQKDEQLNRALEASDVIIWSIDLTGQGQHYLSRNISGIFGVPEDEHQDWRAHVDQLVIEEDRPVREAAMAQLMQNGYAEAAYRLHSKNRGIRWMNIQLRLIKDAAGRPVRREGIGVDITEVKKQEAAIRQSEANLRTIFDNTEEGFTLVDSEHVIVAFNRPSYGISHLPYTVGTNLFDVVPAERKEIFHDYLGRAACGETVHYDVQDGEGASAAWYYITLVAVRSEGTLVGYCITTHDLTAVKRAERMLKASEERFRNLVENSDDLFLITQGEGGFSYVSPNITKMLGYTAEEFTQLRTADVVHPEDLKYLVERAPAPGQRHQFSARARHKNGGWRLLEGSTVDLPDIEGIKGRVQVYHDVTERQEKENRILQAEEAIREHRYLLEKAGEVAQVGYWTTDLNGSGTIKWSNQAQKIYGIPSEAFDGKYETLLRVIHPEDRINVRLAYEQALRDNQVYSVDFRIIRPDGSQRWVHEQGELISEHGEDVTWMTITLDISRYKVIEEVLKEFNERYEILSKATNDAIWDWDVKIGIVTWNHGLQTIFGYPPRDVNFTTTWWKEKIHPEDFKAVWKQIMQAFHDHKTNWDATYRYKCADGSYKYIYDRAYIIYVDREPVRMIGAMQDVSERMIALAEIEKLSLVASQTDSAVMILDADERIEWINEGFTKMTGYGLDEIKGMRSDFLRKPEDDPIATIRIEEKLKRCETVSEEIVGYSKDGRKYWANLEITPVMNEKGEIKNFISIQSDVSERKEYENSITAIAGELASLIEHANVPIFSLDRQGYVNEWNAVTAELSGYAKPEVYGKNWVEEFVDRRHQASVLAMLDQVMGGKPVNQFELPIQNKARKIRILLLSASPRWNAAGVIDGAILVGQDITELSEYRLGLENAVRERTYELNEALRKEKEIVDMKSKFVSIASHEFRTPLTTISLASGFIRKYKQQLNTEQVDKKLDNIDKQISHMTHMLEDVLMIGKAEAGKILVGFSDISLREFIEGLVEEMKENNRERIELQLDIGHATIRSDEKLLRNILLNLLTNALKFSEEDQSVQLSVRTDIEKMVIEVTDEGVGIPEDDIRNLFTPFYRASNVSIIQGTGLGLSIIKKAVDLLKGTVTVKSKQGKGTRFTVILPIHHG